MCKFCSCPAISLGEEAIFFVPAPKCPYHVTFDLDLDFEHTLDAGAPGDHRVQVWSQSDHLPKSVKRGVTSKSYQAADIFDVHDEKLFSAMCKWSNHCLRHLLPRERDTGHDLRHRGHSYQLVCYNFSSARRRFVIRMLYDSL